MGKPPLTIGRGALPFRSPNPERASLPRRHHGSGTFAGPSLTKPRGGGHNEKASLNRNPELFGDSSTALVPEWRNWQTR